MLKEFAAKLCMADCVLHGWYLHNVHGIERCFGVCDYRRQCLQQAQIVNQAPAHIAEMAPIGSEHKDTSVY